MNKVYGQVITIVLLFAIAVGCTAEPTTEPSASATLPPAQISTATLTDEPATPVVEESDPTALMPTEELMDEEVESESNQENETDQENENMMEKNTMIITIGDTVLTATLVDNTSTEALKDALSAGPITVEMRDYGSMEKVGPLGMNLPRNDQQITTEAGDIILYQGNLLVIYYAPNSWSFTRLGKVNGINAEELKGILGNGDVTITISLQED